LGAFFCFGHKFVQQRVNLQEMRQIVPQPGQTDGTAHNEVLMSGALNAWRATGLPSGRGGSIIPPKPIK
jgi:hypothetical protein